MIRRAEDATPTPGSGAVRAVPAERATASPPGSRGGAAAAMNPLPHHSTQHPTARATATPAREARHERIWAMTREERIAAFYRGELSFRDCQAWSRRYPDEPPTGPCGEYLYILVSTPEWLGEA